MRSILFRLSFTGVFLLFCLSLVFLVQPAFSGNEMPSSAAQKRPASGPAANQELNFAPSYWPDAANPYNELPVTPAVESPFLQALTRQPETLPVQEYLTARAKTEEALLQALIKAAERGADVAKGMGKSIQIYMENAKSERERGELIRHFYESLYFHAGNLPLSGAEWREMERNVEAIYIEDGQTGKYGLDPVYFRDMPEVVKKINADIQHKKIQDGTLETFYVNGQVKTVWKFRQGRPHGIVVSYDEAGNLAFIDTYQEGYKTNRKKYTAEGQLEFSQDYPHPGNFQDLPEAKPLPPESV